MTKFHLVPLKAKQLYVSGNHDALSNLTDPRNLPGLVNNHTVTAIFKPINDSPMVLAIWAMGGMSVVNRDYIKILDIEAGIIIPAWFSESVE